MTTARRSLRRTPLLVLAGVVTIALAAAALAGGWPAVLPNAGAPASPSHPGVAGSMLGSLPGPTIGATLGIGTPLGSLAPVPASPTASAGATAGAGASPTPSPAFPPAAHVWLIVMENHEYGSIIGNPAAPYLNHLAATYGLATDDDATSHPSEPNYIALVAGSTDGVTTDGTYNLHGPSLFSQLAAAGLGWRAYEQNYPGGCFTGSSASGGGRVDGPGASGTYVRKHDPAISFTSVSRDPAQCADIQPLRDFNAGAAPFELITPNLINDMHDGTVAQGDAFLRAFVPEITRSAAFAAGGVLFITFDEGSTSAGRLGDHGGHVVTLIIRAGLRRGFRATGYADHFSLLATTERLLGLPCLAGACDRSVLPL